MQARSVRDDPELVRQSDEELYQDKVELTDDRWSAIFDEIIPQFLGEQRGLIGHAVKLMIWQARKYVARDPEGSRFKLLLALQVIVAKLRIEPRELFPE